MVIYAGSINRDHVHMLIGIPPQMSVSRAVQYLKGKGSHRLLSEYKSLRKRYWGQHLWASGYWVASSGNVTDKPNQPFKLTSDYGVEDGSLVSIVNRLHEGFW